MIDYYFLKLRQYMLSCHPERKYDMEFIQRRAESAAQTFTEASKAGKTVEESIELANSVLYQDLLFSPYLFLKDILSENFQKDGEEEVLSLLTQVYPYIERYNPGDDFMGSAAYGRCRLELIGKIREILSD